MATKKPVEKKAAKEANTWIGEIEKYSRQIWLAGLGAFSKASKDGNSVFDALVKDGEKAEKQAKTGVAKQVDAVKTSVDSAKSKVEEVKEKAVGKWNELEEAFDKRLNNAISRMGVPSRNEVKALQAKVENLAKQIEKLTGVSAKPVKAAAARPAAKAPIKAAAKPAAKAPARVAAKPVAKPVAKAPAKPAAKAPVKAAVKPAAAATPAAAPAATPATAS